MFYLLLGDRVLVFSTQTAAMTAANAIEGIVAAKEVVKADLPHYVGVPTGASPMKLRVVRTGVVGTFPQCLGEVMMTSSSRHLLAI